MWGCGGGSPSTDTSVAAPEPAKDQILVAALGDSITAGSPLWDPDPDVRASPGGQANPKSQFEYWASQADPRLRFRNCGVFGERTDQIAGRLPDCARGADALIVQGGINDIAQSLGSGVHQTAKVVDAAAANLESMVRTGKRMGMPVFLTNVLPWNNGGLQAAGKITHLNEKIEKIGRREDVPVLPFYESLEDRHSPGTMRSDWTIDGDHPSIAGYAILGERAVAPALRRLVAKQQ